LKPETAEAQYSPKQDCNNEFDLQTRDSNDEQSFQTFSAWTQLLDSVVDNQHFQKVREFVNGLNERIAV